MVKLTPRRKQLLVAIGWRIYHYGVCKVADLLGDLGISHMALFDHLEPLKKMNLVEFEGKARNLSSNSVIMLTPTGQKKFEDILNEIKASLSEPLNKVLEKVIRKFITPTPRTRVRQKTLQDSILDISSSDARITKKISALMHRLFNKNITEPIITSLAMYSDIDQLLYDLKKQKNPLFTKISRGWLNLEIREGRLASIAIPVALKGMLPYHKLLNILRASWAWPAIVSSNSIKRYKVEANSLGLVSIKGDIILSTKPSTSYILQWLADKTYLIFENSFSPNPKLALLLYRESFNIPSENEIFEPETSNRLNELLVTKEILGSDSYQELISRTFSILKQIGAIVTLDGSDRIIPYGYLRTIESIDELGGKFKLLIDRSREGNIYSDVLLIIQSKPGITLYELAKQFREVPIKTLESILDELQSQGLVIPSVLPGCIPAYYTFLQVPYINPVSNKVNSHANNIINEINAIIRYYTTYVLSKINIFTTPEELQWLYNVIEKLLKEHIIESSYILNEFNEKFTIKFTQFATQLEPLIKIEYNEKDVIFKIADKQKDYELAKHLLDIIAYEILTGSEALGEYTQIWSRVYELSRIKSGELLRELYEELISKKKN